MITFNIMRDVVTDEDSRWIAVIGIYKKHYGAFIVFVLLFTFVTIAFVRMNRELMGAIEFNMVQKVHFE